MTIEFCDRFPQNTQILKFMQIGLVGSEFYAEGETDEPTDVTKWIIDFRSFNEAPMYHEFTLHVIVYTYIVYMYICIGAWGGVVVKALRY